jgi:plasmid stability protein
MNPITLRNVPAEVARAIRRRARRRGLSLNRAVIELLGEALGLMRRPGHATVYTDLDPLMGTWTKREADAFDRSLAEQRTIDPELWK